MSNNLAQDSNHQWQFWIDRGGTFTDIVAQSPDGNTIVHKLLSENPDRYSDAPIQGIRDILGLAQTEPIPIDQISAIKMGTTVATNALLERKGDRTVLLITKGFRDALRIGYQHRPNIFARQIILPEMLYERVIEIEERYSAHGEILIPLNADLALRELQTAYDLGIRACAIALMHSYRYPEHEQKLAKLARQIGFTQVSVSHEVSSLIKFISRGDTTVVDAYLSPILRRYVDRVSAELGKTLTPPRGEGDKTLTPSPSPKGGEGDKTKLMFMQSNGGLAEAHSFQGKNSILSGPAGGIVGAVQTCLKAGFEKIISFDMGGTSTDVAHYAGSYERSLSTEVAGVRLSTPMMSIHTVAAGGGSLLFFDGARYRVGPESAGAFPGPACYRHGGALAVTDCNVMLGKLQPDFFPKVFGKGGNLPLDREVVRQKFRELAQEISAATGQPTTPEAVAQGFLEIAIAKMAMAIKKISVQRGYDVTEYVLCCFGGAGGQHACAVADVLGMTQVFIHPYAGVLSAYGIGLADIRTICDRTVEAELNQELLTELAAIASQLSEQGQVELLQGKAPNGNLQIETSLRLRYGGTDSSLNVAIQNFSPDSLGYLRASFEALHQERYGFIFADKALIVEAIAVEIIISQPRSQTKNANSPVGTGQPIAQTSMYMQGTWQDVPVYRREDLRIGDRILGAALIIDDTGTNVIEPNWEVELDADYALRLQKSPPATLLKGGEYSLQVPLIKGNLGGSPDPIKLEIFNNLFQSIAEQMGLTLQNTSASVNIRERLDFSCAIFDREGELVANAPHIPVHLGSMGESVKALICDRKQNIHLGDVFATNNPYNGGTHLPDITVITPVFIDSEQPIFYVASRGHHADIGGITPGSMPSHSTSIEEEGILFNNFQLVKGGKFCEVETLALLTSSQYPARNPSQNIADLQAQIAANECGARELRRMVAHYGAATVQAYMGHVRHNAELAIRQAIAQLAQAWGNDSERRFIYPIDNGSQISVSVILNEVARTAKIDFTGTSAQLANNFNAPLAVCKAVVLYVFRTLVDDEIPLNAGCLVPLEIIVPEGSMLNPVYPAAVVAGNVETSQAIANTLYGALGVMAASQGTMNNFTFGSDRYQYYETICGGSGAGINFDGTDAIQTHMTNSRLTDPEILEWRFPVLLEEFAIRKNSSGKGKHQGGNGVIRRIKFLEPMTAAILSSSRVVPPFGLNGGEAGATGRNYVIRNDGAIVNLASTATVSMEAGDTFVIETPSGGGYGEM
ncbi:hydantoinase B/oxoprolinase family protein [Pseudanabaena mucicola]|uniref:Hydantoinase B/oxoprolinase family protein n=1 Tax=Pseudanabaena mucicola FACHB-723 TaxID=2692860 RepID=A0ABR7ZV92_9CYAN|nr:hydantoinase B/oxoprolinase family protein [Pseudanabaena mucicola]MBD2187434.1 hydantoinase B/oxoprolinase family protein [Pseudanabaena mucicola FACHB-723]